MDFFLYTLYKCQQEIEQEHEQEQEEEQEVLIEIDNEHVVEIEIVAEIQI